MQSLDNTILADGLDSGKHALVNEIALEDHSPFNKIYKVIRTPPGSPYDFTTAAKKRLESKSSSMNIA